LPLPNFLPGEENHRENRYSGPQRRDNREQGRQDQANERQLNRHSHPGDQQTSMNSQPKGNGKSGIAQHEQACDAKLSVV
jgi:hypothetical protein